MKKTSTLFALVLACFMFQNCSTKQASADNASSTVSANAPAEAKPAGAHDKELQEVAASVNKTCPFMADKDTRLDNCAALPGDVLQYNYTLVNTAKADIDTNQLINYLKPRVVANMKTNPDMKALKDYNVTLAYTYKDKNGVYLFKVAATPADYNK